MIYEIIPTGRQNAVTTQDIAALLGMPERGVRSAIAAERLAGKAICAACSAPFGLYKPGNVSELEEYAKSLQRRTNELVKANAAIREQLDEMTGQVRMEDTQ